MGNKNDQFREIQGLEGNQRLVTVSTTLRVGRPTDAFVIDQPVLVNPGAALTITVPDGYVEGQRLLITYTTGTTHLVTVSLTGTNLALTTAGDYASLEWVNDTSGWVTLNSQETG